MILSAGLSPAWQQIVTLDTLRRGEVNRARHVCWCASGKVLNVGIALGHLKRMTAALGGGDELAERRDPGSPNDPWLNIRQIQARSPDVLTLAPIGGSSGVEIESEFKALGFPARWIEVPQETRVCTTLLDQSTRQTTEIVENARSLDPEAIELFCAAYLAEARRSDVVVLTGSFPPGVDAGLYRDLIRETPGRVILDAQGPPLLAALEARPLVIKPNREELGRTLGRSLKTNSDLFAAMRECHERGASWVIVTQGSRPVWIWTPAGLVRFRVPKVKVSNPIGSGDCLAAGLALGLACGWSVLDAMNLAIAAAAQNAESLLPARLDFGRVLQLVTRKSPEPDKQVN